MQKALIVAGLTILVIGLLWPWLSKLPLGRLPGDILVEREGFRFYPPGEKSGLVTPEPARHLLVILWSSKLKLRRVEA